MSHGQGFAGLRVFVSYFRKTVDGRILMGFGSGPIDFAGNIKNPALTTDRASAARAEKGLRRLPPGFADVPVEKLWGGGIDVSSGHLPFFRTVLGTRIHYGTGYSGRGVKPCRHRAARARKIGESSKFWSDAQIR